MRVSSCCLCCELRTGMYLLTGINVISSLGQLSVPNTLDAGAWVPVSAMLNLMMSFIGMLGACRESPAHIRVYASWLLAYAMVGTLTLFLTSPDTDGVCSEAFARAMSNNATASGPVPSKAEFMEVCTTTITSTFWGAAFFQLVIQTYFAVCAYSYYLDLLELPLLGYARMPAGYAAPAQAYYAQPQYAARPAQPTPLSGYTDVSASHQ